MIFGLVSKCQLDTMILGLCSLSVTQSFFWETSFGLPAPVYPLTSMMSLVWKHTIIIHRHHHLDIYLGKTNCQKKGEQLGKMFTRAHLEDTVSDGIFFV